MSIHIKPENKGKFTALKKRTGHSATWFKQHGTPAQRKMATFAQNARKWKHADGGNLYEPGGQLEIPEKPTYGTMQFGDKRVPIHYVIEQLFDHPVSTIRTLRGKDKKKKDNFSGFGGGGFSGGGAGGVWTESNIASAIERLEEEKMKDKIIYTPGPAVTETKKKSFGEIFHEHELAGDEDFWLDGVHYLVKRDPNVKPEGKRYHNVTTSYPTVIREVEDKDGKTLLDSTKASFYSGQAFGKFDRKDDPNEVANRINGLPFYNGEQKAYGGNLFNFGGGTLTGSNLDYGMSWNNDIDKLRAANKAISQIGQKVSSMSSMASAGNSFNPQQDMANARQAELDNNLRNQALGMRSDPNALMSVEDLAAARKQNLGIMANGGNIQLGVNNYKYNPPKEQGPGFIDFLGNTGINSFMKDFQNNPQQMMSTFGNMQQFGQNFGSGFKNMFGGNNAAGASAAAPKACGGKLHKCGGNLHCGGGNLFDYGGDFSNGLTFYNNGGTHEENPYEGVQVGTDNQGTPNLVEEGEVRYKDYVFSNRLSLDEELAEKYNIPKKYSDATFAYIAEKMGEESKEREYDPISQRGLKIDMEKLRAAQEETRAIKAQQEQMQQVQQIADELGVAPEDVIAAMQMQQEDAAQQQMMAQQQPSPEEIQMMQQQPSEEEMMAMQQQIPQEAMPMQGYAYGGTLFDNAPVNLFAGGISDVNNPWYSALKGYTYGNQDLTDWLYGNNYTWINPWGGEGYIATTPSFDDRHYKYARGAEKEEADAVYQKFTQAILDNPELREWYFKQYDAATPGKSIRTKFYDKDGNLRKDWKEHFLELRKDNKIGPMHNIARRLGTRYFYTDPNGNRVYVENPGLGYTTTDRGIVDADDGINRWHDYEIMRRKADTLPVVNNPAAPQTPQEKMEAAINPNQSPTTNSNNQQPTGQTTVAQANPRTPARVNPNYSILDFVPLYEYLTAGKPDYYQPDALVDYTNRMPKPTYKPIGDFVQYHPFDRQYAANQQRARTEAQIRNNWNISGGNRGYAGAMNLATNMQAQLADAEMQRQADAANLQQQMQVATFNRGTNQYNADAFNRLQLAMPSYYQLGLQSRANRAQQHYMIDRDFGASKSANLNTWLKNMYARRREAEDAARVKWLADSGAFGELSDPGYPYPINGNNTLIDWLNAGNWQLFAKKNNNTSNG